MATTPKLQRPEHVRDWLIRRYNNKHRAWLEGGGDWPLTVSLGTPTEAHVAGELEGVRAWVDAWRTWSGAGTLVQQERKWARIGSQTVPATLSLATPAEVAAWCGQERRWVRACTRYVALRERWPQLQQLSSGLGKFFDVLADYSEADFERLQAVLTWSLANPASGMYVRQLPIVGVDTKWLEKRTGLVTELIGLLRGDSEAGDFYEVMGLRRQPHRVRLRLLCPELRNRTGGLRDIEAPLTELAALGIQPSRVVVLENRESGVALPDMPGTVAFVGLGHAVSTLSSLPWVDGVMAAYWGDIDTHGLAILSAARATLPGIKSVLMDTATLLEFKELAVQEPSQATDIRVAQLTEQERALFDGLRAGTWGNKLRLEQERLPWSLALEALHSALNLSPDDRKAAFGAALAASVLSPPQG